MALEYTTAFANAVLDTFTGRAAPSTAEVFGYVDFYFGTQTASPSVTPGGAFVLGDFLEENSIIGTGILSAAASGFNDLVDPPQVFPAAANSGTVTTARFYGDDAATPIVDVPATVDGGNGGVILTSLTAVSGSPFSIDVLAIGMPSSLGTVSFNTALQNAMVDAFCFASENVAALTSATITAYTGTPPASANDSATGTALWTATTAAAGASYTVAAAGSTELVADISEDAIADGTATYIRITKGAYVVQATAGTSGTDAIFDSVTMTTGMPYSITDMTITMEGF